MTPEATNLIRLILSPEQVNRELAATLMEGMPDLAEEVKAAFPNIPEKHRWKENTWAHFPKWDGYFLCRWCEHGDFKYSARRQHVLCENAQSPKYKEKRNAHANPCRFWQEEDLPF